MAKRITTILLDDIDGSAADESITFALDGVTYQIDLNSDHATQLRESLKPYIKGGRKIAGSTRSSKTTKRTDRAAVRAWASQNGRTLGNRGRIPAEVLEAYQLAQG